MCRDLPVGFVGIGSEKSIDVAVRDRCRLNLCIGPLVTTTLGEHSGLEMMKCQAECSRLVT